MKTSLHKHSFRTVGLALAIGLGLGLAAASHSAQAATVQITLGGNNWTFTPNSPLINTNLDVTLDGNTDGLYLSYFNSYDPDFGSFEDLSIQGNGDIARVVINNGNPNVISRSDRFTFTDSRINGGAQTIGWAQGTGSYDGNSPSVTLTRVVFDNASTTAPSFNGSETGITEWSASSTAVPEPGTFIPAAVLVMGALLRRRRSRSHRSGRATA